MSFFFSFYYRAPRRLCYVPYPKHYYRLFELQTQKIPRKVRLWMVKMVKKPFNLFCVFVSFLRLGLACVTGACK